MKYAGMLIGLAMTAMLLGLHIGEATLSNPTWVADPRGACFSPTQNPPVTNNCNTGGGGTDQAWKGQDIPWWIYDVNHDGVVNGPGDVVQVARCANNGAGFVGCALGRDKFKQPFSPSSPWNMPIGTGATYTSATLAVPQQGFVDEEYLFLDTTVTPHDIKVSTCAGDSSCWDGTTRCDDTGANLLTAALIPAGFTVPDEDSVNRPNNMATIIRSDGRTLDQTQPLTDCNGNTKYTSGYTWPAVDIYGLGITGAHGGSGLSAIGGTIRLGEWVSGGAIKHAVKIDLPSSLDFSCSGGCYRWPATNSDCGTSSSCSDYTGSNAQVKPGALLAILPSADCDAGLALVTEAAKIMCHAMQTYGAYVVDNSGWNVMSFNVEVSPAGDVGAQFAASFGFSFSDTGNSNWVNDVKKLAAALNVVTNNDATHVGGGGSLPSGVSYAPPIKN